MARESEWAQFGRPGQQPVAPPPDEDFGEIADREGATYKTRLSPEALTAGFNERIVDKKVTPRQIADWIEEQGYTRPSLVELKTAVDAVRKETKRGKRLTGGLPRLIIGNPDTGDKLVMNEEGLRPLPEPSKVGALVAGLGQSTGYGGTDEAAAWLGEKMGRGSYDDEHKDMERWIDSSWHHYPVQYGAGRVLGAVPGAALGLTGAGLRGLNWLTQGSKPVAALKSGLFGAGTGGAVGALESSQGNRGEGGMFGSAIGGTIGAAIPVLGPVAGQIGGKLDERIGLSSGIKNWITEPIGNLVGRVRGAVDNVSSQIQQILDPVDAAALAAQGRRIPNNVPQMRETATAMREADIPANLASVSDHANLGQYASYGRRPIPERQQVVENAERAAQDFQTWVPSRVDAARDPVPHSRPYSTNTSRDVPGPEMVPPGPARHPDAVREEIIGARGAEMDAAMGAIRGSEVPITPEITEILSTGYGRRAINNAVDMAQDPQTRTALQELPQMLEDIANIPANLSPSARDQIMRTYLQGRNLNVGMLDLIRRNLNDMGEAAQRQGNNAAAATYFQSARQMQDIARAANPDYANAVGRFAQQSRSAEAVDTGEQFLTGVGSTTDEFVDRVGNLSREPSQRIIPPREPPEGSSFHAYRTSGAAFGTGSDNSPYQTADIIYTAPNGEVVNGWMRWRRPAQGQHATAEVGIRDRSGGYSGKDANRLGPQHLAGMRAHIQREFPEIGTVTGYRETGARAAARRREAERRGQTTSEDGGVYDDLPTFEDHVDYARPTPPSSSPDYHRLAANMSADEIGDIMRRLNADEIAELDRFLLSVSPEEDSGTAIRHWLDMRADANPSWWRRLMGDESGSKTIGGGDAGSRSYSDIAANSPEDVQRLRNLWNRHPYHSDAIVNTPHGRGTVFASSVDNVAEGVPASGTVIVKLDTGEVVNIPAQEVRSAWEQPNLRAVGRRFLDDESGTKRISREDGGFEEVGAERMGRATGRAQDEAASAPPPSQDPPPRTLEQDIAVADIAPRAVSGPSDLSLAQESAVRGAERVAGQSPAHAMSTARRLGYSTEQGRRNEALFPNTGERLADEMGLGIQHTRAQTRISPEHGSSTAVNLGDDATAAGQAVGAAMDIKTGGLSGVFRQIGNYLKNSGVTDEHASRLLQIATNPDPRVLDEALDILERYYGNREQARIVWQSLMLPIFQASGSQGAQAVGGYEH